MSSTVWYDMETHAPMSKRFQQSQIERLRTLLLGADLILDDKAFAERLIRKFENAQVDSVSRSAYAGMELLLNQDKIVRAKTARRFATKKIDLIKQTLSLYSEREIAKIVEACHLIQMTDGCTVACAWCYLNAQPYVQYSISYESIRQFIRKYAARLPEPVRFYWASDPLDWYDGEKSYVDLVAEFHDVTGFKKGLVTTTSLPMGAELTLLRLIEWFDGHFPFKKSRSFVGDDQHYLKNNAMKKLFYNKTGSYDIHSLFDYYIKNLFYHQSVPHVMKISETDANYKRLKAVFDVLKFMGVSESCLSWIEVETRDVGGFDGVRKSGRAYKWDDRDLVLDSVSMACWDSVIVFPGKIGAMEMCGVTSSTQRGLEFWLLEPGKLTIPKELAIVHYAYYEQNGKKKGYLLPYLELTDYVKGSPARRRIHYSTKRDIQAYGLLLSKTMPMIEFIAKQTHKPLQSFEPWQEMQRQYKARRIISDKLLADEKDAEVIGLARNLISRIDEKISL